MRIKPPTVPLYVRIPFELREILDAATHQDDMPPWRTIRLQDLVIEALYEKYAPHLRPKRLVPDRFSPGPGYRATDEAAAVAAAPHKAEPNRRAPETKPTEPRRTRKPGRIPRPR